MTVTSLAPASLRRRRLIMAFLAFLAVLAGSTGLFAPAARAAAPTVTASIQRTSTGTGQGTADQCVVNAAHGFTPGDETAADDYVCTLDKVGYRVDLAIKSDANPTPVTLVFKIGSGVLGGNTQAAIDGLASFCISRAGQWTVRGGLDMVQVDGVPYPSCTLTPEPNVNLSYRQDFTYTVPPNSAATVPDAQILQAAADGSTSTLATGAGFTALRNLKADLRLQILGDVATPIKVNGAYYIQKSIYVTGDSIPVSGVSAKKGIPAISGQSVKLALVGAPPGTLLADTQGNPTDTFEFRQTSSAGWGTQNGGPDIVGLATAVNVLVPLAGSGTQLNADFAVRVAQDSPVLKTTTGDLNMGGGTQIGQQLASCTQGTDSLGGLQAMGGMPNNDCVRVQIAYTVPADLVQKRVTDQYGYSQPTLALGNAQGQTRYVTPGFFAGQTAYSKLSLSPLPGQYTVDACDVWNPSDQSLQTTMPITVAELSGNWPQPFAPSQYTVYYSHQDGADQSCGDPSALSGWTTDPSKVSGAINAVRITLKAPVDTVNGIEFSIPFTPNLNRTDLDEFGATPQLWDHGYVTTGRTSGWGTGAAAFSIGAASQLNAYAMGYANGTVSPGGTGSFGFGVSGQMNGTLQTATPRLTFTLPPCASPNGTPDFGADWTVKVQPGQAAGGPGCEDDTPTVVTATASHPFGPFELGAYREMTLPVRMSPLATETRQTASVTVDYADPGVRYVPANADSNLTLTRQAAVLASKAADKSSMQRDEGLTWTMGLSNTLSIPVSSAQWIDVLPYNGDANGTKTAGHVVLDRSTVPAGVKAEYSKAAPASVSNNPADASNQAGGGTVWCDSYTAGGDCPSSLSEVTAVRYTADLPSGANQFVQLSAHVDGAKAGDSVSNRLGVGTSPDLAQPVPSPDAVTTALFASAVAGTVWWDQDQNGAQGSSEAGIPGVRLEDVSASGDVLGTTTTDAAGHYAFRSLLAGGYTVRVVDGQQALSGAQQTYSYSGAHGADASLTSSAISLGRDATVGSVDFGFAKPGEPTPTDSPTATPSPTDSPTSTPSPTDTPTSTPTGVPTGLPTGSPSPSGSPTGTPTKAPTTGPTGSPSAPATSPAPGKSPSSSPSSSAAPSAGPTSGPGGNGTPGSSTAPTPGSSNPGGPSQGSNPGGVNTPGSLAYTGVRVGGLLLGAVVLIVAGVLVARRRREEREQR
ncbi:SdrD B-like domain-containing protein [Arthrobacter sp. UM1]|uniref:SdrD B-like domain-containing protein n=1 Tax=Arthrobacter sp. UM1 TaxID=2766776 RepID=UPI001CF68AD5|nr:SdrD B-like domain-containing protein [Arthrobacter sp. UM1]MCB4209217.1 hypothetical protein [Arthrobacter sp. UM1]